MTIHYTECEFCEAELTVEVEEDDGGKHATYEECECQDARLAEVERRIKSCKAMQAMHQRAFDRAAAGFDIEAMRRYSGRIQRSIESLIGYVSTQSSILQEEQ